MRYFIFKEDDEELSLVDLSEVAAAQVDMDDYTVTVTLRDVGSIVQDFRLSVTAQHEFLRLTTELQRHSDEMESLGQMIFMDNSGRLDD